MPGAWRDPIRVSVSHPWMAAVGAASDARGEKIARLVHQGRSKVDQLVILSAAKDLDRTCKETLRCRVPSRCSVTNPTVRA